LLERSRSRRSRQKTADVAFLRQYHNLASLHVLFISRRSHNIANARNQALAGVPLYSPVRPFLESAN
jgi:hypothetical protein